MLFGANVSREIDQSVIGDRGSVIRDRGSGIGEVALGDQSSLKKIPITDHRSLITDRSLHLMETAGRGAAQWILSHPWPHPTQRSLIVCGKGNNGGDGLVVARYLAQAGWQVDVLLSTTSSALSTDAAAMLKRLRDLQAPGVFIHEQATPNDITQLAPLQTLIVDALLGTGVKGPVVGPYAEFIEAMASSGCPVLAMDLPSGLNADTGVMQGPALSCVASINFGTRKRGCYYGDGPELCGEVVFVDLGFSEAIIERVIRESEPSIAREYLILPEHLEVDHPKRSYKYDGCSVVVVGGSPGMVGAPIMAARAAWSLGLGDVRCVFPKALAEAFHVHLPFLANVPIGESSDEYFEPSMLNTVLEVLRRRDSVLLLGPGLGRHPESLSFVSLLLKSWPGPTLLDADALLALSSSSFFSSSSLLPTSYVLRPTSFLLTPHSGELRALVPKVEDPLTAAELASKQYGATVLAKGFPSVTHSPDGSRYVTGYDTRIFNKVGYGDVLAGLAAGYMALGGDATTSAIAAQTESHQRYMQLSSSGHVADPWMLSLPDYPEFHKEP